MKASLRRVLSRGALARPIAQAQFRFDSVVAESGSPRFECPDGDDAEVSGISWTVSRVSVRSRTASATRMRGRPAIYCHCYDGHDGVYPTTMAVAHKS